MSVKIADLQIKITDDVDKATSSLDKLATSLNNLKGKTGGLAEISPAIKELTSNNTELVKFATAVKSIANSAGRMAANFNNAASSWKRLTQGTDSTKSKFNSLTKSAEATSQAIVDLTKARNGLKDVDTSNSGAVSDISTEKAKSGIYRENSEAFNNTVKFAGKLGQAVNVVRNQVRSITGLITGGIVGQMMKLLRLKVLRSLVTGMLQGMSEGMQNVYQWAKLTGNQFATSMDTIATATNYAKNSIGAAFSSVLNNLAPIIDSIIDWLVQAINYINMFFAALNGSSTYVRAKKNAVEYAQGATNAIGGTTGAVKELKEELTTLSFDELNQLKEATQGSSGSGGGSGSGSNTDYSNMFEEVKLQENALTKVGSWLKDNFNDVLETVGAIGLGILAWKLSTTINDFIKIFTGKDGLSVQQKLGITFMVTGTALEYFGAKGIGKGDAGWENVAKTIVGSALSVGGALLTFGTNPAGWAVGIGLAITTFVTGFTAGKMEQVKETLKETSLEYNNALTILSDAEKTIADSNDRLAAAKETVASASDFTNIAMGENLLASLREISNQSNLTDTDISKAKAIVEAFNNLGLDGVILQWDYYNGRVVSNQEEVAKSIELYKQLAQVQGIKDAMAELYTQQSLTNASITVTQANIDSINNDWATELTRLLEDYLTEEQISAAIEVLPVMGNDDGAFSLALERFLATIDPSEELWTKINNSWTLELQGEMEATATTAGVLNEAMTALDDENTYLTDSINALSTQLEEASAVTEGYADSTEDLNDVDLGGALNKISQFTKNSAKILKEGSGEMGTSVKAGLSNSLSGVSTSLSSSLTGIKKVVKDGMSAVAAAAKGELDSVGLNVASTIDANLKKAFQNHAFTSPGVLGKIIAEGIADSTTTKLRAMKFNIPLNAMSTIDAGLQMAITKATGTYWSYYAQGGFPESGELFVAQESGPEMVGTIGGRTAVANNDQIASALARALAPMLRSNNSGSETINVSTYLDSQVVARASAKGQRALNKQFNIATRA